jgi:hypothetical protein
MRATAIVSVFALSIAVGGCSKASSTSGGNQQADGWNQSSLKPIRNLKWPGAPDESQIMPTKAGEETHYRAMLTHKQPEGNVLFSASVTQFPGKGADPNDLLEWYLFSSQKSEISRKKIEVGPNKHPGFDITTRSASIFGRMVVVMAGPRLYEVSVTTKNEKLLGGPEVKAFIDSFTLDE